MPHPRSYEREYPRQRDYSPSSSSSSYRSDSYDRHGRAVQPYYNSSPRQRDSRAVQRYSNGYDSPRRPVARRRSDSYLNEQPSRKEKAGGFFKEHGAEILGAAVGGYAGHRAGDSHLKTASGAAVGGVGGKMIGHAYGKWNDRKEEKRDGARVGGYGGGYDDYGGRSSRSVGRGRSDSRERDRQPQGWKDMGRQLKRSLSRKRERGRENIRDHDENPRSWKDVGREIKRNVSQRRNEKRRDSYDDYSDY